MPTKRTNYKTGTTKTTTGTYNRTKRQTTGAWPNATYAPTRYTNYKKQLQAKIGSYRTINQQFTGAGKVTAFSPTAANQWIKYVDTGCRVFKFNNTQFCRYFGANWQDKNPTAIYRFLKKEFGTGIKAVTRGKGNNWLIAATQNVTGKPFNNYAWK